MSGIPTVSGTPRPPMVHAPLSPQLRPAGPSLQQGITVQDIIRVIKKRMWFMIATLAVVFVSCGIGTYVWAKWFPSYRAAAYIEVKTPTPPPAMAPAAGVVNTDIMEQYINTQATLIRSTATLQEALGDVLVRETSWYRSFGNDVNAALLDMEDRLGASPVRGTWYVRVSFSWRSPEESATITNVVVNTYFKNAMASSQGKIRNELQAARDRADETRNRIEQDEKSQERFRALRNIPVIEARRARLGDNVAVLNEYLAEIQTEHDSAQAAYDMYHAPGAKTRMAQTPEMRQMVEIDDTVRSYQQQLDHLRVRLGVLKDRGPNNRAVKELESNVTHTEKMLLARKSEVQARLFKESRERSIVELDRASDQVNSVAERLTQAKAELDDLETQLAAYLAKQEAIEAERGLLEQMENYIQQLSIQLSNPELVRVAIGMRAVRPLTRSSPLWSVNLPGGLILGILLGGGLAFLIEFMTTSVKTSVDVVRQLNMPLLGQVPSLDDDDAMPEDMNRVLIESPQSMLAESFRQLRTNLLFSAPAEQQRALLITSCSPDEGKTSVAVNLATSLAQAGRKVLLVDVNFRRPGVAQAFGVTDAQAGFSNVLIGEGDAELLIHKTVHENLEILPSGPCCPNPAELLGGSHLAGFLQQCKNKYQTVIFDGPPLLVVSDALVLATAVDGVVLVVRAGLCGRGTVQRAREQLRRLNAKLLGVVLNDVRITRGGYFREMYRTYYEYQTPAGLPSETEEEAEVAAR